MNISRLVFDEITSFVSISIMSVILEMNMASHTNVRHVSSGKNMTCIIS